MTPDELATAVGPTIERYLAGDSAWGLSDRARAAHG